jgi:two-component system chemotaxis response regulator CheB
MERRQPHSTGPRHNPPLSPHAAFDVVALAASAGGLAALSQVLASLPANFPAGVVVVQHLDPRHRSLMADILRRRTTLQVQQAEEGDRVCCGMVNIAPRTGISW